MTSISHLYLHECLWWLVPSHEHYVRNNSWFQNCHFAYMNNSVKSDLNKYSWVMELWCFYLWKALTLHNVLQLFIGCIMHIHIYKPNPNQTTTTTNTKLQNHQATHQVNQKQTRIRIRKLLAKTHHNNYMFLGQ